MRATIVKTTAVDTKPMKPEEAALKMELSGHGFLAKADTAQAAVLHRRHAGNLKLTDAAG